MFKTRFTELTGIRYPIMQGAMMWITRAELVAEVSKAGCLGTLTALTFSTPAELSAEIKKIRAVTKNPFAVNLTFLPTFIAINYDSYIDTIISEGIRIVETAGNNPEKYIARLKAAGITVIHKCTSLQHARKAVELGCDVISIDGCECAGHPGEDDVTSMVLIPICASKLKVPVIGSGGFADGRGLVAALALGAEGVNMGTRFMMTKEAPLHKNVQDWLCKLTEKDTLLLLRSFKNTTRVVKNPVTVKAAELESKGAKIEELAPLISGKRGLALLESGDVNGGMLSAGQVVGLIEDVPSVKDLVDRIIKEAEQVIGKRLPGMVKAS
jgi:NADH:quinone reductase (non-electrogenic)